MALFKLLLCNNLHKHTTNVYKCTIVYLIYLYLFSGYQNMLTLNLTLKHFFYIYMQLVELTECFLSHLSRT